METAVVMYDVIECFLSLVADSFFVLARQSGQFIHVASGTVQIIGQSVKLFEDT